MSTSSKIRLARCEKVLKLILGITVLAFAEKYSVSPYIENIVKAASILLSSRYLSNLFVRRLSRDLAVGERLELNDFR